MLPRHIVAIQLKIFTPVGIAISIVEYMKNNSPDNGIPTVYIWCAQTMKDKKAIPAVANTIDVYPKSGLRAKVGMTCEIMPKAGKIRI